VHPRRVLPALVLAAVAAACAGARPTPDEATAALAKARAANVEQGPTAALPLFEEALRLARAAGDRRGEAVVLGNIGVCHKNLGDYPRAMQFHEQSLLLKRRLDDREQIGRTLSNIGQVRWLQGRYTEALAAYDEALAIFDALGTPFLRAAALNGRSLVYDELGDYRQSRDGYGRALALYAEAGEHESDGASDARGNLGGVALLLGRFDEAEQHYTASLAISEKLGDRQRTSIDLGNLGLCALGRGDFTLALARFDRALALARGSGLSREEADWEKGRSRTLMLLGRHEDARRALDAALAHYERAGQRAALADALLDLGALELELGELGAADAHFARGESLSSDLRYQRAITAARLGRGDVESRRQRWDAASDHYRRALVDARRVGDQATVAAAAASTAHMALRRQRADEADAALAEGTLAAERSASPLLRAEVELIRAERELRRPDPRAAAAAFAHARTLARELGAVDLIWRAEYGSGRAAEAEGQPARAIAAYRAAVDAIESVRGHMTSPGRRAGYLEGKLEVYQALVRLLIAQGRADEAFEYAERLRARAFRDLLLRAAVGTTTAGRQVEQQLAQRVRHLHRALEDERRHTGDQQRQAAIAVYSAELAAAEREYFDAMDRLVASGSPLATALRVGAPDVPEVAARLPPRTALVEYLIVADGVAAFVVRREGLKGTLLAERPADLHASVDLLRDLITRPPGDQWRRPAARLHAALVAPLVDRGWLDEIDAVLLVPHGVLHYVPFAMLPESDGPDARVTGDRWSLATLPSAGALVAATRASNGARGLYAAAPARTALPHAEGEVRRIAPLFPGVRRVLVGQDATEGSFKAEAGGYRTVHLATHGFFNKHNPLFSGVELEPDADNDGRLQVFEVLGLRLSASLVTLSACDTGLGAGQVAETPAGEEFIGLTQAFLSAGSRAVLASLWAINDRSTAEVMARFYQHSRTASPVEALARAQRELRKAGGREAHPYYWAPFVLVSAGAR
jgi:CHAT domain-containing protein